uniref:Neurokinin A n=1 Tax=Seriola dumerili TaxID=41447 RepID=A0A3B4UC83_SERDU
MVNGSPWRNVRMIRKPGPRQYLGLMGKKDSGREKSLFSFFAPNSKNADKRLSLYGTFFFPGHKFQTFVGLMGKRSFEDKVNLELFSLAERPEKTGN